MGGTGGLTLPGTVARLGPSVFRRCRGGPVSRAGPGVITECLSAGAFGVGGGGPYASGAGAA